MFSTEFLKDAGERALSTVAQAVLALLTTNGTNLTNLDWQAVLSAAVIAGVISLLKSVIAAQTGSGSASLIN